MSTPSKKQGLEAFSTRLPPDMIQRIKLYCVKHNIRLQYFVAKASEKAMKEGLDEVS